MAENDIIHVDLDEAWLRDWAALGLERLESYLALQAAFTEFLRTRGDLESDDGDCAPAV